MADMMSLSGHNFRSEKMIEGAKKKKIGMSKENPPTYLYKYTFPDGRVFIEFVQKVVGIRSGMLVMLALKDKDGNVVPESLWRDKALRDGD